MNMATPDVKRLGRGPIGPAMNEHVDQKNPHGERPAGIGRHNRSPRRRAGSYPLEVLFDLAPRQPQHHRPAVRADRRICRAAQLVENVEHLLVSQRIVGLDGGMAGGRGGNLPQRVAARSFRGRGLRDRQQAPARAATAVLTAQDCRDAPSAAGFAAEIVDTETRADRDRPHGSAAPAFPRAKARPAAVRAGAGSRAGPALSRSMTRSNSTRSCATCWSMMAMPSASIAMMNVSRN